MWREGTPADFDALSAMQKIHLCTLRSLVAQPTADVQLHSKLFEAVVEAAVVIVKLHELWLDCHPAVSFLADTCWLSCLLWTAQAAPTQAFAAYLVLDCCSFQAFASVQLEFGTPTARLTPCAVTSELLSLLHLLSDALP